VIQHHQVVTIEKTKKTKNVAPVLYAGFPYPVGCFELFEKIFRNHVELFDQVKDKEYLFHFFAGKRIQVFPYRTFTVFEAVEKNFPHVVKLAYLRTGDKKNLDDETGIFHGEVINTRDFITFQGTTVAEIRQAFQDSVEDYLTFCKQLGQEPEKPFTGRLMLRLSPDLHRRIYIAARQAGKSLNAWIAENLDKKTTADVH
jgi:predicted HicB family RNase H-like nuclease